MRMLIVGSGVTGQATGQGFSIYGHDVVFHDIDANRLATLRKDGFNVTQSLPQAVQKSDIIFVCVPTPTANGSMDFSFIQNAIIGIGEALNQPTHYHIAVIRSTILPSATRLKVIPLLEEHSRSKVGEDFGVCMNPEFLRDESALQDFLNPNRIVIGEFDKQSGDFLEKAYSSIKAPIIRTDLDSAEMIKYASNLFLATKISFFNEIYMICKNLNIDSEVLGKVVSLDPRIGKYGVYGGRPFDGKCLPKDLEAFRSFVKSLDLNPILLDAVSSINNAFRS
jgi:nucleotide sugar dehydrogenase